MSKPILSTQPDEAPMTGYDTPEIEEKIRNEILADERKTEKLHVRNGIGAAAWYARFKQETDPRQKGFRHSASTLGRFAFNNGVAGFDAFYNWGQLQVIPKSADTFYSRAYLTLDTIASLAHCLSYTVAGVADWRYGRQPVRDYNTAVSIMRFHNAWGPTANLVQIGARGISIYGEYHKADGSAPRLEQIADDAKQIMDRFLSGGRQIFVTRFLEKAEPALKRAIVALDFDDEAKRKLLQDARFNILRYGKFKDTFVDNFPGKTLPPGLVKIKDELANSKVVRNIARISLVAATIFSADKFKTSVEAFMAGDDKKGMYYGLGVGNVMSSSASIAYSTRGATYSKYAFYWFLVSVVCSELQILIHQHGGIPEWLEDIFRFLMPSHFADNGNTPGDSGATPLTPLSKEELSMMAMNHDYLAFLGMSQIPALGELGFFGWTLTVGAVGMFLDEAWGESQDFLRQAQKVGIGTAVYVGYVRPGLESLSLGARYYAALAYQGSPMLQAASEVAGTVSTAARTAATAAWEFLPFGRTLASVSTRATQVVTALQTGAMSMVARVAPTVAAEGIFGGAVSLVASKVAVPVAIATTAFNVGQCLYYWSDAKAEEKYQTYAGLDATIDSRVRLIGHDPKALRQDLMTRYGLTETEARHFVSWYGQAVLQYRTQQKKLRLGEISAAEFEAWFQNDYSSSLALDVETGFDEDEMNPAVSKFYLDLVKEAIVCEQNSHLTVVEQS